MAALDTGAIDPSTVFRWSDLSLGQVFRYAVPVNTTNSNGNRPAFDLSKLQEQVAHVCGLEMAYLKWDETPPAPLKQLMADFQEEGFELLGIYQPRDTTITIYVERCRRFAEMIELRPDDVIRIVLIHEQAHRVHHLGNAEEVPGPWKYFHEKSKELLERLAQETTLIMIERNYPFLLAAFEEMVKHAPTIYRLDSKAREECHKAVEELSNGTSSSETDFARGLRKESDRHVPDRKGVVTDGVDE